MAYIKALHIEGLKKFTRLDVTFNEHMNILVGENEAGKSTILEAIKIVLNQQYRNAEKTTLHDLFNTKLVDAFKANPSVETLPCILIEIELDLSNYQKDASYFYGEAYGEKAQKQEKFGVRFECSFDKTLGSGVEDFIRDGNIPYEYYSLTWKTFANLPYTSIKRPMGLIGIDTSGGNTASSFNQYNKALFVSKYDETTRAKAKNEFRANADNALELTNLPPVRENARFGIDSKKVVLESVLSVFEDSVALENRGSGMENLIKTQIALDRHSGLDSILIEEPENHLGFSNLRKMLQEISDKQNESQIIIATHNSMIASRLNLNNILWIGADGIVRSLASVSSETAKFFVKADDNGLLRLLLAENIILVEGPTEALLVPEFYEQITGHTIEADGIVVISCNGISYKRYLDVAKSAKKKIAVITDNDGKLDRINQAQQFNEENYDQHIFMGCTTDEWTWEACILAINEEELEDIVKVKDDSHYLFHGKNYGPVLGKMLNNKVDTAYEMLTSEKVFAVPQYVQDAIAWLGE